MVWRLQDILRGLLHRSRHLVRGNVSRGWCGKHVSGSFQEHFDNMGVVRDGKVGGYGPVCKILARRDAMSYSLLLRL